MHLSTQQAANEFLLVQDKLAELCVIDQPDKFYQAMAPASKLLTI